jgi:hypothetical protein
MGEKFKPASSTNRRNSVFCAHRKNNLRKFHRGQTSSNSRTHFQRNRDWFAQRRRQITIAVFLVTGSLFLIHQKNGYTRNGLALLP